MTRTMITLRSPAAGMAWQLWTRHRSGFVQSLLTFAVCAACYPWLFRLSRANWMVAFSAVPLVPLFGGLLVMFMMIEDPARASRGFPRRMFPLPVPTHTLVFWPMALGAAAMALAWVATACLLYWPSGFAAPLLLPALGIAAGLAWFQALAWCPFASPAAGVLIVAFLFTALGMTPVCLDGLQLAPRWVVVVLVTAYLPAAFLVALAGVRSGRRGDTWRVAPAWLPRLCSRLLPRPDWQRPFASLAKAQEAFEWRNYGLFLPAVPTFIIVFFLPFALVNWHHRLELLGNLVAAVLGITTYAALMSSMNIATMKPFWIVRPFAAGFVLTRPFTSEALVWAKYHTTWRSVLWTWVVTVGGIALWVVLAGAGPEAASVLQKELGRLGDGRGGAAAILLLVAAPGVLWSLATELLAAGLTGNSRVMSYTIALLLTPVFLGTAGGVWCVFYPEHGPRLLGAVPWLLAGVLGLKVVVAAWAFRAALGRGLIGRSSLIAAATVGPAVFASVAALLWLVWPSRATALSLPVVMMGVAALTPLGRFALAPLALDRARHA